MTDITSSTIQAKRRLQSYQRAAHLLIEMHEYLLEKNLLHTQVDKLATQYQAQIRTDHRINKRTQVRQFLGALQGLFEEQGVQKANWNLDLARLEQISVWHQNQAQHPTPSIVTPLTDSNRPTTILAAKSLEQDSLGLATVWRSILAPKAQWPAWFKELSPLTQKILISTFTEQASGRRTQALADISKFLSTIPSSLRCIPGLANLRQNELRINEQVTFTSFSHALLLPVDVSNSKERLALGLQNAAQLLQLAMGRQALLLPESTNPVRLPVLFQSLLSPGPISHTIGWFNSNQNDARHYREKEAIVATLGYALAHPGKPVREDWLKAALSPQAHSASQVILYRDALAFLGLEVETNGYLKYGTHSFQPIYLSTNHPLNLIGRLHQTLYSLWPFGPPTYFKRNAQNRLRLIQLACETLAINAAPADRQRIFQVKSSDGYLRGGGMQYLDELLNTCHAIHFRNCASKRLLDALEAYQDALGCPKSLSRRRPLYLASLEDIIVYELGGVPTGSCKSGKDRFGLKTLHTQAMLLYRDQHGCLPRYTDKTIKREKFNDILAKLYLSGHFQRLAACNAPGAEGIVKAEQILARDTCRLIKQRAPGRLQQDSAWASMNKPKPTSLQTIGSKIAAICQTIQATMQNYFSHSKGSYQPLDNMSEAHSKSNLWGKSRNLEGLLNSQNLPVQSVSIRPFLKTPQESFSLPNPPSDTTTIRTHADQPPERRVLKL